MSSLFQTVKNLQISLKPPSVKDDQQVSILTEAYYLGSPMHITPDRIEHYSNDPLFKVFKTNELVIMPLKAKNKVKGIIIADNFYTQKPIRKEDLKIFMMLANQAGLAIENSQLYEMAKHRSHTDSLTGLWNHGFFQNQLSLEIKSAQTKDQSLCLMIIDIDDFKKINDQYGHQCGDLILKEIAELLKDSSREIDYVCRYGGEEFSIILSASNLEQGYKTAERVRKSVAELDYMCVNPSFSFKTTVSIGLAEFPCHATTKKELIAQADKAMYIAKFSGKNRTHTSGHIS